MEHEDSLGNKGVIRSMGCQWMTAGSGILHQEMPQPSERMLGCQLWVNLPAAKKMVPPAYRDISPDDIPVVMSDKATVRVLSGSHRGIRGALDGSYVQITYLDVTLPADASWKYGETRDDDTLFLYLLEGTLFPEVEQQPAESKGCAILYSVPAPGEDTDGPVEVKAGPEGARFLLFSAPPLKEPVVWGGPIVMNTREELEESFKELRNGTFIK